MTVVPFEHLACPLDGEPLTTKGITRTCGNGHSFDIARKGYTNLLPVQNKRSLNPGDHKEMVAARQRFLESGYYQPVAEALSQSVLSQASSGHTLNCVDAGCGEGYYFRALAAASHQNTLALLGVDISKWAVMAAARQDQRPNWVVGSNANLPILSDTVDVILCMFGFPVYAEFSRVLKPGGILLQVDAGNNHLKELREIIYPSQKQERESQGAVPEGFTRLSTDTVNYAITLDDTKTISDLLAMTPHFYRATAQGRATAEALTELEASVDVTVSTLIKG